MAAIIRSLRNGVSPVIGASRDDLVVGDLVTVNSVDIATTYSWSIAYKPPGSAAVFSGSVANASPGSFTVDEEGPYLIRLIVDLGLPTENEQFVRLRYLTVFGDLQLVAAGEQYGGTVNVPVDIAFTGWADEQNYNLRTILGFVARVSASGRILYVDANASTEGYGDHSTIQSALDAAAATASPTTPWVVAVRPGTYTEDLTLRPNVHVIAWPGSGASSADTSPVLVQGFHTLNLPNAADVTVLSGLCTSVSVGTTNPGIDKSGDGTLVVSDCRVSVGVVTPTQGPAIRLTSGPMTLIRSTVLVDPANPDTVFALEQLDGQATVHDCDLRSPSGVFVPATAPTTTTTDIQYTRVEATGGAGACALRTDASTTTVRYSAFSSPSPAILVHPGGGAYAGAMTLDLQWSSVSGTVSFDTTGIAGAATLSTGAVAHGGFVFPGGSPTLTATVRSDSVFYDNTVSGLTSDDAQGAIDELVALLAPFTAGYTLEQAYNGGGPGAGRTIVADSGSVRILDGAFPSDPIPAGNTNGNLEVVGKVSVGALTKPEIDVDPNPYGTGPQISMGWTVVPNNSPTGVGVATVVGRSTESPLYRNYDLRLGTQPASGGGKVGDVVVRAGDGTQGGVTTPNPGSVYILAGSGLDGTASRGNVILSPGVDAGGNPGAVVLVDPRTATPASVTAAGVCSSPVGVTGTITFATDLGAATATINAVDTLAVVVSKLDALLGLSASSAAGIITVSSRTTGLSARVYFLSASAGLDAALGTFDGQPMTSGTYPDYIAIQTTAANEVTFGANGMTGPLVYNADTGKLTVPGLIDPTGMVFEEAPAPGTSATQGAVFVSDGTGGLTLGDLYYQGPSSAIPVALAGGGGGSPTVTYVYRPGGVASANVYTDFNLLYSAMSAVEGPKAILFDNTGLPPLTPVDIPPKSGGGYYSFRNVSAYGLQLAPGSTSFPGPIVRFDNDGVNQAQCDSFFDYSRCIAWVGNTLAALPAVVLNDVNKHIVIVDNCSFTATGAAEFFQVDGGGGFPVTFLDIILRRSSVVGAASGTFRAINAGSISVSAYDSPLDANTLATDAPSYIAVSYDALTFPQATQPGCAAGTYDFTARAEHLGNQVRLRDALPSSNTITLSVSGPNEITIGSGAANPMIYDAVTGKLTVPGIIDPTALVLEAATAPATGATEGAIFVSDGTGGLTSGSFYLRPASNATPINLTGALSRGADLYANVWPAWKKPCRVATTVNVALLAGGAPLTVDGVAVTTGDRVLVTVQTAGAENGIYRVTVPGTGSDGTWVRDDDFDTASEIIAGLLVYVQEGSQNSRTRFTLVTTGAINLGVTTLEFIQEAPLVRTDATSTAIIAAGTAFTNGTIVWSSALNMRDYSEVSVWFNPTNIGSNTQVDLYVQWSDDGTTIPFDDDNGVQQTDFLLATGSTGVFQPKDYVARLTTVGSELVSNAIKMLSFPKKGGSMRFGVMGNSATGTFGARAQRLA